MADENEDVDLKLPLLRKSNISVTEDLLNEEIKKESLLLKQNLDKGNNRKSKF